MPNLGTALAQAAIRKLADDLIAGGCDPADVATALVAQGIARGKAARLDWATALHASAHSLLRGFKESHDGRH